MRAFRRSGTAGSVMIRNHASVVIQTQLQEVRDIGYYLRLLSMNLLATYIDACGQLWGRAAHAPMAC